MTFRQLEDSLAGGCTFCETEVIDVNDRFAWIGPNRPVCSKCIDGDYAQDDYSRIFLQMEMLKRTVH